MALTREQVRDRIWSRLEANTGFYEQASVDRALNLSISILNLFIGRYQGSAYVPSFSVANQHIYNIPSPIVLATAIYMENRSLRPARLRSFSLAHPFWLKQTSSNTGIEVANWIPIGMSRFAIWPADSVGGAALRVDGIVEPPLTGASDEVIPFGEEAAEALEEHAIHFLSIAEGGKIMSDTTKVIFNGSYRAKLYRMKRWSGDIMPQLELEVEKASK